MILRLYAGAASIAAPALKVLLRRRVRRGREIEARLPERWGCECGDRPAGRLLWLHGASVGEAMSILPVLPILLREAPDLSLLLTTGTVTSAGLLERRLPELGLDGPVRHRFVPLDVPAWVARFLDHWRPDAVGFVEQEIWPNLLAACARRGIPAMLLNARLSARSAARWRLLGGAAGRVFAGFERITAQSEADAQRLSALGGRNISVPGNLKFAAAPLPCDAAELARLRTLVADRRIWLAASTHPGEEALVLHAHAALARAQPVLTIIVPRHPQRGAAVAALAAPWPASRRALGADPPPGSAVFVADTVGELGLFYRLAGIAFVGGSLVAHGGQNPLEAARLGCAVAIGPHTQNFAEIVASLDAAGAAAVVATPDALAEWVASLWAEPARAACMGAAGIAAASAHADLPERTAALLLGLLRPSKT